MVIDNIEGGGKAQQPFRIIHSKSPLRICDNGGWTDTWFAKYGSVFNIAIQPGVSILMKVFAHAGGPHRIAVHSNHFGDLFLPASRGVADKRFRLVEAIIANAGIPENIAVDIQIHSDIPPGSATGTSAAVAVALLGAFEVLHGREVDKRVVWNKAHNVETHLLHQQSGIQDQICSAFGGINFIEISEYPSATVHQLAPSQSVFRELEERLLLIYLGTAHSSSAVHEKVIRNLEAAGPDFEPLSALRRAAVNSRDAIAAGDVIKLGLAMRNNTNAQARLHPELISKTAAKIIAIAEQHKALGWKVNGAGGEGGSLTLLSGSFGEQKLALIKDVKSVVPESREIPFFIDRDGLTVCETET